MSKKQEADLSTELKIKEAARRVFHQKGYAATRTRDIATAANINLALLNYYFRSKEQLFNVIMLETFRDFIGSIQAHFNDEQSSLEEKIEKIVSAYLDLLSAEPNIPIFIVNELRTNPQELLGKLNAQQMIASSDFARQYHKAIALKQIQAHSIFHFILNLMGLIVFPFLASPMLTLFGLQGDDFRRLIEERRKLIPIWIKAILQAS